MKRFPWDWNPFRSANRPASGEPADALAVPAADMPVAVQVAGPSRTRVAGTPGDGMTVGDGAGDGDTAARTAASVLRQVQVAAEAGICEAMLDLAGRFETGDGVVANLADAAYWYQKAADAGSAVACRKLAALLMMDQGSARLTGRSAALARLYPHGAALRRDPARARALARRAAEAGDTEAQATLGFLIAGGIGGPADPCEAALWYREAAAKGHAKASVGLGTLLASGQVGPADHKAARRWFAAAADLGNGVAHLSIGLQYLYGLGETVDPAAARAHFDKAVAAGNIQALRYLGIMAAEGHGRPPSVEEADGHFRRAAARGDLDAMVRLGDLYAAGTDAGDFDRASAWYRRAANAGHRAARDRLEALRRPASTTGAGEDPAGAAIGASDTGPASPPPGTQPTGGPGTQRDDTARSPVRPAADPAVGGHWAKTAFEWSALPGVFGPQNRACPAPASGGAGEPADPIRTAAEAPCPGDASVRLAETETILPPSRGILDVRHC